jgi:hypothetical protein
MAAEKQQEDTGIEVVASTQQGQVMSMDHNRLTVYYDHKGSTQTDGTLLVHNGEITRDAGVFLAHVIRRYDSLSNLTAFVHWDAWMHNPIWPRWLDCLRSNATRASLSPLMFHPPKTAQSSRIAEALLGPRSEALESLRGQVPATCCFHMVFSRETLRSIPKSKYEEGLRILDARNSTAFDLENVAHLLASPPRMDWLKPRESFRTQEPHCSRTVQYTSQQGRFVVSGIDVDPKGTATAQLQWQERACGVEASPLVLPETRELLSVRQTVNAPCAHAMKSLDGILQASSCYLNHTFAVNAYVKYVSRNAHNESFPMQTPMAKLACFPVKPAMCCGLVRCWQRCCAECGRRSWCKAWAWHVNSETCALSEEAPRSANATSFEYVVGAL